MSLEDLKDACTRAALSINLQSLSKMELRSDDNNKFCNVWQDYGCIAFFGSTTRVIDMSSPVPLPPSSTLRSTLSKWPTSQLDHQMSFKQDSGYEMMCSNCCMYALLTVSGQLTTVNCNSYRGKACSLFPEKCVHETWTAEWGALQKERWWRCSRSLHIHHISELVATAKAMLRVLIFLTLNIITSFIFIISFMDFDVLACPRDISCVVLLPFFAPFVFASCFVIFSSSASFILWRTSSCVSASPKWWILMRCRLVGVGMLCGRRWWSKMEVTQLCTKWCFCGGNVWCGSCEWHWWGQLCSLG